MIFVFGSNLRGVHGAGAAAYAMKKHGAIWGVGVGIQGDSYGIPTKDMQIMTLPLRSVEGYVSMFIAYAFLHPELQFKVTQIGCGLAGFTKEQIAPLFQDAPANCLFDRAWESLLPSRVYWN